MVGVQGPEMVANNGLRPGDIMVLPDAEGRWSGAYEYVGTDDGSPDRLIVRDRSGDRQLYSVRADQVRRPAVSADHDATEEERVADPSTGASPGEECITDAQRRCLFAMAHKLGMEIDDLRAATPQGSISKLSRVEAAALIDRLGGQPGSSASNWRAQGTATAKQLGMIAHLRDLIGFTEEQFSHWLTKRFKVTGIAQITDKGHASRVIGGLLQMHAIRSGVAGSDSNGHRPGRSQAGAGG